MVRLIVQLMGGLGNQMFQYAAARSLALSQGAELVLDDWSGFVRDRQYRRHYELSALPIQARLAKPWERLPIWGYRLRHRHGQPPPSLVESYWYGQFITESEYAYQPQMHEIRIDRTTWITGYWQSPCYFRDHVAQIRAELMPPPAWQERYRAVARQLQATESVALGIRLYEESKEPGAHARDGKTKSLADIRAALVRLCAARPEAKVFVFCTHRSPQLSELDLPEKTVFVTCDDGYTGTLETLWLLAQCRHHILTNSSYFWWGAWLSAANRGSEGQRILAANNFKNHDGLCSDWETF